MSLGYSFGRYRWRFSTLLDGTLKSTIGNVLRSGPIVLVELGWGRRVAGCSYACSLGDEKAELFLFFTVGCKEDLGNGSGCSNSSYFYLYNIR